MAKKDILAELKSAIGQKMTPQALAPEVPKPAAPARRKPATRERAAAKPAQTEATPRNGRGVQFYLDEADRKIISSLAVWFMSQDRRVSDSQVIKTAIRMAEVHQGAKLLELCDAVRATDRRYLKRKVRPERAGK
jgi:hypothetical protein